jgi:hypothetical protein
LTAGAFALGFLQSCSKLEPTSGQIHAIKTYATELNMAEVAYSRANPNLGFSCEIQPLVSAHLIDARFEADYILTFVRCKKTPAGVVTEYSWVASSKMPESGKSEFYCGDQTGVIRVSQLGAVDCIENGTPFY